MRYTIIADDYDNTSQRFRGDIFKEILKMHEQNKKCIEILNESSPRNHYENLLLYLDKKEKANKIKFTIIG